MLRIDGSEGEGGGQIVRTALGLSLVTQIPFEMHRVRAGRRRPGLLRQHLTALEAAARIGGAPRTRAGLHADRFAFEPRAILPGEYHFDVGTAGSATLVFQAVLPALLVADSPSRLVVRGGTHNPFAPPFEFLERVFLPLLRRMGADVEAELVRPGFFPAGGGEIRFAIRPSPVPTDSSLSSLAPLSLLERGRIERRRATAVVANLPRHVADRELAVAAKRLGWKKSELDAEEWEATGPGNFFSLCVESAHATEVVTGFGAPGLPAERVAEKAARSMKRYLKAGVPVGEHLADQLLIPLALAGGGAFRTLPLSPHARTNAALIERFLPVRIEAEEGERGDCLVRIDPAAE